MRAAIMVLGSVACAALAIPAMAAGQSVAIVEEVTSPRAGVEWMDYVDTGRIIRLAAKDSLTLSYLASCKRETIVGGVVTIGADQSRVQGGKVERAEVRCGTGRISLTPSELQRGGAFVSRSFTARSQPPKPAVVHATQPLLQLPSRSAVHVQRLDQPSEVTSIDITDRLVVRRRFLDFSLLPVKLEPGGVYLIRSEAREMMLFVDARAEARPASIVSRLLRFPE